MLRGSRTLLLFAVALLFLPECFSQTNQQPPPTPPIRDAQAVAVLQQAFAAMGNSLPAGSFATGTVTIVEGSSTESGTIRITSRGSDQSVEDITTASDHRIVVYSRLSAAETKGGETKLLSFESSATNHSLDSPLTLIAWALTQAGGTAGRTAFDLRVSGAAPFEV